MSRWEWGKCCRCYPDNPWFVRVLSVSICIMGCIEVANHCRISTMESYSIVTDMIDLDSESMQRTNLLPVVGHQVRYVTVAGIVAGLASVVLGAIGFVGQMMKSSTRICVYSLGSLVLLFVASWRLIYSLTSVPLLDAVVDKSVTAWCEPANRLVYSAKLGCPSRSYPNEQTSMECGAVCQGKVKELSEMGGCRFLNRICQDFSFEYVGKGQCLAEGQDGQLVPAPYRRGNRQTTEVCCKLECNLMRICRGYSFHLEREVLNWHGGEDVRGSCDLITPDLQSGLVESPDIEDVVREANITQEQLQELERDEERLKEREEAVEHRLEEEHRVPHHQEPRRLWKGLRHDLQFFDELKDLFSKCTAQIFSIGKVKTWDPFVPLVLAGSDKYRQTKCYKKGRPRIVQEALNGRKWSSIISAVNTLLLALATITGLFYQYSLATKRRGRKGLAFVLRQMLCPCLGGNYNRTRKISCDNFSSSESDGSSSRSSSSSEIL